MFKNQPKRHPFNTTLSLFYKSAYKGLPVMKKYLPMIEQYLERLYQVTQRALAAHPRVLALRLDLRFPRDILFTESDHTNLVISVFTEELTKLIRKDRYHSRRTFGRVNDTEVHWAWAREQGDRIDRSGDRRQHYHFVLLLNRDAYNGLGDPKSDRKNLYSLIRSAWAKALRITPEDARGLVYVCKKACFSLYRELEIDDAVKSKRRKTDFDEYFKRSSYICKATTKVYGCGNHAFGSSRPTRY